MALTIGDLGKNSEKGKLLLEDSQIKEPIPKITEHHKIEKIQGLRGFSILAVLLAHIRNDWFPFGYFGVDVFFVISGYLMCSILSRYDRLAFANIMDFYFRRIKRILPIYLFVIWIFSITAMFMWLFPLSYSLFRHQMINPLIYIANHEFTRTYERDSIGGYHLFLHLWSLSVEIQFYLLVPFLIIFLSFFSPYLKTLFVILIASLSWLYQLNARLNVEHMALSSRIWQFMFGFLAYYFSKSEIFERSKNPSNFFLLTLDYASNLLFFMFMYVCAFEVKAYTRLVLLSATIICLVCPVSTKILTNRPIVWLGDISYSVYLIHWFVYSWHHYVYFTVYMHYQKPSWLVSISLITVSILLGYIVETSYNRLSTYLNGWKSLAGSIIIAYLLIYGSLRYLKTNAEEFHDFYKPINKLLHNRGALDKEMMDIWNENDTHVWNETYSMGYNVWFRHLNWDMYTCIQKDESSVPTKYNIRPMEITSTCYMRGNGTKNMLIIGNSHALTQFYGLEKVFKGIYSNLTLVGSHQCMLVELESYRDVMEKHKFETCELFLKDLFKMLKKWNHPIHIIVVAHAYLPKKDPPITNISNDKLFREIQSLYSRLSKFAKEALFIPVGHLENGISPFIPLLNQQIRYNKNLDMFRMPMHISLNFWPNLKQRIRNVKCNNCILLEWDELWCNKKTRLCDMIDFKRGLTYFSDKNHHNAFGSLIAAKYVKDLYLAFQRTQNSSFI